MNKTFPKFQILFWVMGQPKWLIAQKEIDLKCIAINKTN